MKDMDGTADRNRSRLCALIIFPAAALGVLAMIYDGVSAVLWGQQIAAWALLAWLVRPLRRVFGRLPALVCSALLLGFLAASLFGLEAGGARRWVSLVLFRANAAQLVLPALLVMLCRLACPYPALLGTAAILAFQPDLSQLAALIAAAGAILWQHREKRIWNAGVVVALGVLVWRCMRVPVAIEPVSYCEGVLSLLGDLSRVLQLAGWAALAAIPAWFAYRFYCTREPAQLCLALYYAAIVLFAFTGEYPVPIVGFGLSPIAGYYLACSCADAGKE